MPAEFIYTTYRLARHYPPDRTVLEDISLSFYPGAKIGVIGPNGAGKSSLLRIMAGLDDGFTGEARLTPGFSVGLLPQEPQLDPGKDVKANVLDGVRPLLDLIDEYNAVMARWSEPDADYEAIGAEQAALEDRINATDAWNVERNVEIAMEALRCPPDDDRRGDPVGRRDAAASRCAGCCSSIPTCCCSTSRRTISTPNRSSGWNASSMSTAAPSSRSPTIGTSWTTSRNGSWSSIVAEASRSQGNYSSWLEQKLERLAREQKQADARQRTLARELEWVRMGSKARQAKGRARLTAYEQLLAEANDTQDHGARARDRHPAGATTRRSVIEVKRPAQGLRRQPAHRGSDVRAAALGHRRHHRPERGG